MNEVDDLMTLAALDDKAALYFVDRPGHLAIVDTTIGRAFNMLAILRGVWGAALIFRIVRARDNVTLAYSNPSIL